ncbi:MAG: (2Fe-2S)-binding protein [Hyphomicrobiales bacterium]|nr:(2Fe-2S)-binding protein [Hyphomicrobiales bacterium]
MSYRLMINGKMREVEAEPDTPLLWVLRDDLKLTGTKFGCGVALCGACTVHLDGDPIPSCQTPVASVEGMEITTIEGVSGPQADAIRKAWVELEVPQCGYCQTGQIMTATALLVANAKPSDGDIDNAMNGVVCRCATYHRIRAAIHRAAAALEG